LTEKKKKDPIKSGGYDPDPTIEMWEKKKKKRDN
jgi:hypothetical protein